MFSVEIDRPRQFLCVTFGGFLAPSDAAAYVAAIKREFAAGIGVKPYVMMIDTRASGLQSQDVVRTLQTHVVGFPKATRIALISESALVRMQLRRVVDRDYAHYFDTPEAAGPWLFADWPPAPVARPRQAVA